MNHTAPPPNQFTRQFQDTIRYWSSAILIGVHQPETLCQLAGQRGTALELGHSEQDPLRHWGLQPNKATGRCVRLWSGKTAQFMPLWHCEDGLNRVVWDTWYQEETLGCHDFSPHHQEAIAPAPSSTPGSSTPGPGTPVPTAGSVPSPSGSVLGAAAPFRPLFNDFGPPSMGYVQAMKPPGAQGSQSTYTDLLSVTEEMGKEIRPTYAGSKSAMERLKRGIIHARALVRECLAETERNART
ncbi:cyclin-dependent kinase 2-associated protein 2-like [Hyaena hyaena]|uniref:cyclin-dependent kinase 2-associated protein 2-like n=1 Tax=Hyaena hyaena TaxID=95912 RepID=UPI00192252E6|nr:cyclin-dependent kinase 2-associated protein 2-like [Hyaena hyaena]